MIGRIRTVKPELWQHYNLWLMEQVTRLPIFRGFQGLWSLADREGRFEWKPQILKLNCLPFDAVDPARVMEALRATGYIGKYMGADRIRLYGFVLHWRHQAVNARESATRIPQPPAEAVAIAENLHTLSDLDLLGTLERAGFELFQVGNGVPVIQKPPEISTESADASATRGNNSLTRGSQVPDMCSVPFCSPDVVSSGEMETDHLGAIGLPASEPEALKLDHAIASLKGEGLPVAPEEGNGLLIAPAAKSAALPAIRGPRTHQAIMDRLAAVSDEIQTGVRRALAVEQMRRLAAELVFSYWTVRFNHPKARLDDKREQRVMERLKENDDDVSELLYALDGAYHDDFIMGRGKHAGRAPYDGIETILRDRPQVERFSNTRKGFNDGKPHSAYVKYLAALGGGVKEADQVSDISAVEDQPMEPVT